MLKKNFNLVLILTLLVIPLNAAVQGDRAAAIDGAEFEMLRDDIEVIAPVSGLATAHDTYDIYAPFDGRIEEVQKEIFSYTSSKEVMAKLVSVEMAAMLDATTDESREQMKRRWQDVYKYYDIKPEFPGIITSIYTKAGSKVFKGDRLFTVAKKVLIVAKNTEPIYSAISVGMTGNLSYSKDTDVKVSTKLTDFMRIKDKPLFYRLWLEVDILRSGIKVGGQFDGTLFIGRQENTPLVPRAAVIEKSGKKFLLLEVETGLQTADEIEVLGPGKFFIIPRGLNIKPGQMDTQDGKNKKIK